MTPAETLARLRLARSEGVGPGGFRRLLARHGSAAAALAALPGLPTRSGQPIRIAPADEVAREAEAVHAMGGAFLHLDDPDYPPLLAALDDAPPVLALLGDASLLLTRQVAVVGARNASAGGRRLAEDISEGLCEAGITVTSGLARGIDAAGHAAALRKGRTIGVLPGGLDIAYPAENALLQERIAEEGLLVAESPLGTAPIARHFPRRNRIVAGLALGVVVVEAALRSGTLITARLAAEAGREVYAVPGSPLDPRCQGSNDLLRGGAHLCERAEDVLETLPESPSPLPVFRPAAKAAARPAAPPPRPVAEPAPAGSDSADEVGQLLDLIGTAPVTVDEVLRRCHLSASHVRILLLEMELDGRIQTLPGNRVVRAGVARREDPEGA